MILENLWTTSSWLVAQATTSKSWLDAILLMEKDKLVIILLFGTGLVSAAGFAIAHVLRAANGSAEDSDALKSQIADLERRVAQLEASSSRVNYAEEVCR